MATEIERKFLVKPGAWIPAGDGCRISQGYLSLDPDRTVRVRIVGGNAFMTVKGRPCGISRTEVEFSIDPAHAADLMGLCHRPVIEKTRHREDHGGMVWEIDVFHGENDGLVLAEIELPAEDHPFVRPPWVGPEVSADFRYSNSALSSAPYRSWPAGDSV